LAKIPEKQPFLFQKMKKICPSRSHSGGSNMRDEIFIHELGWILAKSFITGPFLSTGLK
jgi:hypothetical protein